jgi:hypothetical protein
LRGGLRKADEEIVSDAAAGDRHDHNGSAGRWVIVGFGEVAILNDSGGARAWLKLAVRVKFPMAWWQQAARLY